MDEVSASAHFVISRMGHITQLVPLERAAWHCGPAEIVIDGEDITLSIDDPDAWNILFYWGLAHTKGILDAEGFIRNMSGLAGTIKREMPRLPSGQSPPLFPGHSEAIPPQ